MGKKKKKKVQTLKQKDGRVYSSASFVFGDFDYELLLVILLLTLFGLLMVYSTSYYTAQMSPKTGFDGLYYFKHQGIITAFAIVLMLVIPFIDPEMIVKHFTFIIYIASIVCLFLVDFTSLGLEVNGRKRWLSLGPLPSFQPTEMAKLAVILLVTFLLIKYKDKIIQWKYWFITLGLAAIPAALVVINNLSSAIIIGGTAFFMCFIASKKKKRYIVLFSFLVGAIILTYIFGGLLAKLPFLKDYQISRIEVWRDPVAYASEGGYQVLQGLYAIGSGGLFGKGLGNSTQKLGFVPEASNDMIFSIICEELGLFGAICLMALFTFLFYKLFKLAKTVRKNNYYFFITVGVMIHLALQVIFNIGVVTGIIPNTGITLPFISYGGTSVVFLMIEMGLVLGVSRRTKRFDNVEEIADMRSGEPYMEPANSELDL